MITFNKVRYDGTFTAACYDGTLAAAEILEGMFKGRVRLDFRGIFTGNLVVEELGGQRQTLKPGDYLVDSEQSGLLCLEPDLFHKYYYFSK